LVRERVQRRLMAILAADVVGYSRLIGADDEGTHARLKALHSALVGPKIKELGGRIVRTTGDGLLVLFASVVDCLRCAVEIQREMVRENEQIPLAQRIVFRMGVNVGDVIVDGRSLHGDGVNVAARLEALAEPGGICVSERVWEDVQSKFDLAFEDAGSQQLKNISRPVRIFHVRVTGPATNTSPRTPINPPVLRDHPLFGNLTPQHIDRLSTCIVIKSVKRGERIFAKGEPGTSLFTIESGMVIISLEGEDAANVLGKGAIFGEIALLDGHPRLAHATALTDCELYVIERGDLLPVMREEPEIALRLFEILCSNKKSSAAAIRNAPPGSISVSIRYGSYAIRERSSLSLLASLLWDQGDLAKARPLFERALAICEKALGPEHPDTAMMREHLAVLSRAKDRR
jgi:class 3 adenylate cyclase/CRP-like cAMP-binding protein